MMHQLRFKCGGLIDELCPSTFTDLQHKRLRTDSFNRNFPSRYSGLTSIEDFICIQVEIVFQALPTNEVRDGRRGQAGPAQRLQLPTHTSTTSRQIFPLCAKGAKRLTNLTYDKESGIKTATSCLWMDG